MELARLMRERRTVHRFADRPVPHEMIAELLDVAVWAPNHRLTEPWRFVIVSGDGRRRLAEAARAFREAKDPERGAELGRKTFEKLMGIPMFVAVVMREDEHPTVRREDYAATACVIHNFSLLLWERGLGMVWETYPLLNAPAFREALGVGPGETIVGSLHVGYPANVPPAQPRTPARERMTLIDR